MEQSNDKEPDTAEQGESLDATGTDINKPDNTPVTAPKLSPSKKIQNLISKMNIYLVLFIFILVISAGVVLVLIQKNKKISAPSTINTQTLTAEELKKLNNSEQKVGDPKSTLSVESNTIFSGKVLVRDSLDVAGPMKVGGSLSIPGLNVSGDSNFDKLKANAITVSGDSTIQGQLSVQRGLTVTGGGSFSGPISTPQLSAQTLLLNGDLTISRHITTSGGTPNKSNGTSLGSGGTASISGSDTAGTVSINTGSGAGAGCFVTVTFNQRFASNPHVVITPVGSASANLQYYINRSSTEFSICTANAPGSGQSFSFDYIVMN